MHAIDTEPVEHEGIVAAAAVEEVVPRTAFQHRNLFGAEDIVFVGDETAVRDRLRRYAELGATEILAAPFAWGDGRHAIVARTREFLASVVGDAAAW